VDIKPLGGWIILSCEIYVKPAHLHLVKQHVTLIVARARYRTTCRCGIMQVLLVVDQHNLPYPANAMHEYSMQYNNAGSAYALSRHHPSLCRRFIAHLTSSAGPVNVPLACGPFLAASCDHVLYKYTLESTCATGMSAQPRKGHIYLPLRMNSPQLHSVYRSSPGCQPLGCFKPNASR
jgi:hypothetical protein